MNRISNLSINISGFHNSSTRKIGENFNSNKKLEQQEERSSLKIDKRKANDGRNEVLENLNNLRDMYREQKQKVMTSDMSGEIKKYQIKDINEKISEIESQIQQINIQQKEEEIQKQQEDVAKKKAEEEKYKNNEDEVRDGIIISASLNELIKFSNSKDNISSLKKIRARESVEAGYIEPSDKPDTYNYKRLAQIKKSARTIDSKIAKEINNMNDGAERLRNDVKTATDKIKESEKKEEKENKED